MADAPAVARRTFFCDLRSAKKASSTAVSPDRARATASVFNKTWIPFLLEHNITDPFIPHLNDKIPLLRVFALRVREGRCSRSGEPVSGCHVRDEVSHIAKTFTELGYPDPRLTVHGDIDPRLSTMYRSFCNEDPAPKRVKPMPISVLFRAQQVTTDDPFDQATVDMAWIGFYFLLRPGEYCKSKDNTPIRLQDVTLLIGQQHLDPFTDVNHFDCATHSTITFDQQKNRERGEVIGHGTSGHHIACPTKAIARRVQYLRRHGAEPSTYLCAVRRGGQWTHVTSALVTATLRAAAAALPHLQYSPTDVSSRSLRAGGAMALLCGNIDSDVIRLVGRWKSDAMFRYLHAQALPLVSNLASTMMQHGSFTLLPDAETPPAIIDLINT